MSARLSMPLARFVGTTDPRWLATLNALADPIPCGGGVCVEAELAGLTVFFNHLDSLGRACQTSKLEPPRLSSWNTV
ncbi:hypothetical protein [Pseudomonas sp. MWU13-2105]|uniref:hypothetical protein n=1 Tax=Pseudomonas sp. MWU13-2105 TaxID=2935074 RepID=UPI00200BA1F7|nr:hypothetical protein [Pseudomonas sp. MWU13-2105]